LVLVVLDDVDVLRTIPESDGVYVVNVCRLVEHLLDGVPLPERRELVKVDRYVDSSGAIPQVSVSLPGL
jgi:hypothetical protein